jgi:hypothetical protein
VDAPSDAVTAALAMWFAQPCLDQIYEREGPDNEKAAWYHPDDSRDNQQP